MLTVRATNQLCLGGQTATQDRPTPSHRGRPVSVWAGGRRDSYSALKTEVIAASQRSQRRADDHDNRALPVRKATGNRGRQSAARDAAVCSSSTVKPMHFSMERRTDAEQASGRVQGDWPQASVLRTTLSHRCQGLPPATVEKQSASSAHPQLKTLVRVCECGVPNDLGGEPAQPMLTALATANYWPSRLWW